MRTNRIASALLVLTTACNSTEPAEGQAAAKVARAGSYDIAGVRIGMTLDEARRVLESKGFKTEVTAKAPSFETAIDTEVKRFRGEYNSNYWTRDGVGTLSATKPGERMTLSGIAPGPNGGTVLSVGYMPDMAGRSVEELRAQMISRYGQPKETTQRGMLWCAPTDPCDIRRNAKQSLSYVDSSAMYETLSLDAGSEARATAKAVLDKAVQAKVGKPTSSF